MKTFLAAAAVSFAICQAPRLVNQSFPLIGTGLASGTGDLEHFHVVIAFFLLLLIFRKLLQ